MRKSKSDVRVEEYREEDVYQRKKIVQLSKWSHKTEFLDTR